VRTLSGCAPTGCHDERQHAAHGHEADADHGAIVRERWRGTLARW
jgi:hypothetical protein